MNEAALWERALQGDSAAFGEVFDRHRDRVFRHAYRLLTSIADAEDATAIAFLELWRRRTNVRILDGSALPWLLVTTSNAARNLSRGRGRYRALLSSLPHGESSPSAEDVALRDVVSDRRLASALARLSPADLRLVTLVMIEGFTPAEAAEVLGMTAGAARTRLHRARATLQAQLGETSIGDFVRSEGEFS